MTAFVAAAAATTTTTTPGLLLLLLSIQQQYAVTKIISRFLNSSQSSCRISPQSQSLWSADSCQDQTQWQSPGSSHSWTAGHLSLADVPRVNSAVRLQ